MKRLLQVTGVSVRGRRRVAVACSVAIAVAALLLADGACRHRDKALEVRSPVAPVGTDVLAVVERITPGGLIDEMKNGNLIAWTVVTFTVLAPPELAGSKVETHCNGHPIIGSQRLNEGSRVRFLRPDHPELKEIYLYHLDHLRLAGDEGVPE